VCLHAGAHTTALLKNFNCELFDHPPYSPDFAPNNSYLFTYQKNWLQLQHFSSNVLMEGVKIYLSSQVADFLTQAYKNVFPDMADASILTVTAVRSMYIIFHCFFLTAHQPILSNSPHINKYNVCFELSTAMIVFYDLFAVTDQESYRSGSV
jgi:hypothetical protein